LDFFPFFVRFSLFVVCCSLFVVRFLKNKNEKSKIDFLF